MANLIDKTYFKGDINIPDSTYSVMESVWIPKFEPIILTKLLGRTLYKLILAEPASPQRIQDLVEGKEYTEGAGDSLRYVKWNGLINSELISLIAYFVYYEWMRDNVSKTNTAGEYESAYHNMKSASPHVKMNNAWENLVDLYGYAGQDILAPSAYNFLSKHYDEYPEWEFIPLNSVNSFDL